MINKAKGFIYQNAQLTEYVIACYTNATPQQRLSVSGRIVSKNRNPDVVITAMSMDEKMLLLGELGITTTIVLTTAEKTDNIPTFSKEAKAQIFKQKDLKEEYFGDRKVFIVTTTQFLKYYHLIAQYQNSRKYLFNRDFGELIRNVKQKKKIKELENESQDIRTLIRVFNAPRRGRDYIAHVLKLNSVEEDVLMFLAEKYEQKVYYLEVVRALSDTYKERALKDTLKTLVSREYVRDFGSNESRSFILSLHGWNAVRAILEKCMIEVHK